MTTMKTKLGKFTLHAGPRGFTGITPATTETRRGSNHFLSFGHAAAYYSAYGYNAAEVRGKIAAGEIAIGNPEINPGERLEVNNEGRYIIVG